MEQRRRRAEGRGERRGQGAQDQHVARQRQEALGSQPAEFGRRRQSQVRSLHQDSESECFHPFALHNLFFPADISLKPWRGVSEFLRVHRCVDIFKSDFSFPVPASSPALLRRRLVHKQHEISDRDLQRFSQLSRRRLEFPSYHRHSS